MAAAEARGTGAGRWHDLLTTSGDAPLVVALPGGRGEPDTPVGEGEREEGPRHPADQGRCREDAPRHAMLGCEGSRDGGGGR